MEKKVIKRPSLIIALIPVVSLIAVLMYAIFVLDESPHIPLLIGACVAAAVGIKLGYKWEDLEEAFIHTIGLSMQACIILIIVGLLVGSWILSGTVPTMIYYGLQIISPSVFLPVACIICCIVSLACGSSWTTAATVGVALMGIGAGLGVTPAITAGAIVSGAYFGDKMSPLSDTTNLAPAIAGSTLFDHIAHMVFTTGPSIVIALVLYTIIGFGFGGKELDQVQITGILDAIASGFEINPLLLIPPILVIAMVVLKMPAIPGLVAATAAAVLLFYFLQGSHYESLSQMTASTISVLNDGFVSETGHEMVDSLLSRGGLQSMMWTISLILCAMTFGGIMEKTRCLETIADSLLAFGKGTGSLVAVTIFSCFFMNALAGDQYLAIVIPGRMYKAEFRRRGLAPKNLSRCLEDSGTITSALVPWNTCGAYMMTALGVSPLAYAPYAFLNWMNPIISIIYGFTGITMEKLPESEMVLVREENRLKDLLDAEEAKM